MRRSYVVQTACITTLSVGAVVASAPTAQAQSRLNFTSSVDVMNAPTINGVLLP